MLPTHTVPRNHHVVVKKNKIISAMINNYYLYPISYPILSPSFLFLFLNLTKTQKLNLIFLILKFIIHLIFIKTNHKNMMILNILKIIKALKMGKSR